MAKRKNTGRAGGRGNGNTAGNGGIQKPYVSKRKTFMRIITLVIAFIVIAGLVFIIPFDFLTASAEEHAVNISETQEEVNIIFGENALSSEIKVTETGMGLFTVNNLLLLVAGFGGGFIVSEIARRHGEKKEKS